MKKIDVEMKKIDGVEIKILESDEMKKLDSVKMFFCGCGGTRESRHERS